MDNKSNNLNDPGIKGIIFDLDGVLVDTAEYHYQAWRKVAIEEDIPFNRKINEKLRGISRRGSLEIMLQGRRLSEEKMVEIMERKNNYYKEFIEKITPGEILPGVHELLAEIKNKGKKIAVASVSKNAETVIDKLGLIESIDAIADGYSVEKTKPAPDLFLHAAKLLHLSPKQCVVVEDAESGIEAGIVAGMKTVGVGPYNRVGKADAIFESLAGVTLCGILSGLKKSS